MINLAVHSSCREGSGTIRNQTQSLPKSRHLFTPFNFPPHSNGRVISTTLSNPLAILCNSCLLMGLVQALPQSRSIMRCMGPLVFTDVYHGLGSLPRQSFVANSVEMHRDSLGVLGTDFLQFPKNCFLFRKD